MIRTARAEVSISEKAAVRVRLLSPVFTLTLSVLVGVGTGVSEEAFSTAAKAVGSAMVRVAQPFSTLSGATVTASPCSFRVMNRTSSLLTGTLTVMPSHHSSAGSSLPLVSAAVRS